jgi:hypothetical protein
LSGLPLLSTGVHSGVDTSRDQVGVSTFDIGFFVKLPTQVDLAFPGGP